MFMAGPKRNEGDTFVIERAITLGSTDVADDLPVELRQRRGRPSDTADFNYKEMGHANDRELLEVILIKTSGNCEKAAGILGVHAATVYRRIKNFKLTHLLRCPRD